MLRLRRSIAAFGIIGAVGCALAASGEAQVPGSWTEFGGDKGFTRYSPLDQIDRTNVGNLEVLWRRPAVDPRILEQNPDLVVSPYLLSTPQMIDGILYAPNGIGLVEAIDPATGETIWVQELPEGDQLPGRSNRGLGYWTDGTEHRLLHVRGEFLYALARATGRPIPDFGHEGRVFLRGSGVAPFSSATGVMVVGDVAVIAGLRGGAGDRSLVREREPGNIMGFDVRTGDLVWEFNVVPREGEFGSETWGANSWEVAGDVASWCCISADEELGLVYVPLSSATGYYGGWRPGDNLFSNSLVALDARTGERVWHFQTIHHGIWGYELGSAPILGDITVDGRSINAVMIPQKTGYLFVFDRATGEPVWPIEERSVPQSTVPGEETSPTQPFPTKPAPFGRIGITEDDIIDFTPEIRARTMEFLRRYDLATDLFTPPALVSGDPDGTLGTIILPYTWGSANWNTGAFDPETGYYYAQAMTATGEVGVVPAQSPEETILYPRVGESPILGPDGLPLVKPPYGTVTAIDMNTGEHVWTRVNGDAVNEHPLLRDLDLPPLGTPSRPSALVTKTLLFLGEGSDMFGGIDFGGRTFRAYDKATGDVLWEMELPGGTTSQPMTYLHEGKQYIVVPIGDSEHPAEWVALGLP